MPVHKGSDCVGEELHRFKKGEMHSGKGGKVVTNRQQAKAIALSACGQSKYSEALQSMGYSPEVANEVIALFAESFLSSSKKSASSASFEEIDWKKNFETGKGPGPENPGNYRTGKDNHKGRGQLLISKTGVKGDLGKQKVNSDSSTIVGAALEKGPGNPQSGSSKEVFGMRALG